MKRKIITCFLLVIFLTACTMSASSAVPGVGRETRTWIDDPREGSVYILGEPVSIRWHASAPEGIRQVEVRINGEIFGMAVDFDHAIPLVTQEYDWIPPASGQYLIEVVATSNAGAVSRPTVNVITVLVASATVISSSIPVDTPTQMPSLTPTVTWTPTATWTPRATWTLTATATYTSIPGAIVQFWAEPASIQAGGCTTIRWHVENAQSVIFGGVSQAFDGSYKDCLCSGQRYTLKVILLDGSQVSQTVDVAVIGSCITPTKSPVPPPADTAGPAKPYVIYPKDNVLIACPPAEVTLRWKAPSDPSGIASYWVILYEGSTTIQSWPSVTATSLTVKTNLIDCGHTYIWKVSARDGAGNLGSYELSQFRMSLP